MTITCAIMRVVDQSRIRQYVVLFDISTPEDSPWKTTSSDVVRFLGYFHLLIQHHSERYYSDYQMYVAKDFVDKSWISQPWFFFDVYTPEDAVFHGLSSGVIRVLGGPHFFIQNVEILEKTTNVFIERLSSSTLFSHRFIYMSTRKICELREQEMLFLLV
jgi:hypothetical protein